MNCWFKEDYTEISKERFEIAYSEYIDASGLYNTKQFQDFAYIHHLNNRISCINISLQVQREFLETFGQPYEDGLDFFKKYGYTVYWNGNKTEFLSYLDKIQKREKKYTLELQNRLKLFKDGKIESPKITQTRQDFIRMLTTLNKIGYKIDRNITTVEELAIIIKQDKDERN